MQAHCAEENNNPNDMWVLTRIRVNSNDDVEEQKASEGKVNIHKEMAGMIAHQIAEEICKVENEERTIKERESCNGMVEDYRISRVKRS
jgi:hypothetical protein